MKILDFSRSFLTFRVDSLKRAPTTITHKLTVSLNNARVQLECYCDITDKRTGTAEQYVLGASCKTERVGVERDVWVHPNADFAPIFSQRQFLTIKTYDHSRRQMAFYPPSLGMQSDRQSGPVADAFDEVRIDTCFTESEVIERTDTIIDYTLKNEPLVAVTHFETDHYLVDLQYPIKTINASEREGIYQTDTGPVLFPDLSLKFDQLIDGMELAFCAFNRPDWIEFLVRSPSEVVEGISVNHYCRSVQFAAENRVFRRKLHVGVSRRAENLEQCAPT